MKCTIWFNNSLVFSFFFFFVFSHLSHPRKVTKPINNGLMPPGRYIRSFNPVRVPHLNLLNDTHCVTPLSFSWKVSYDI